MVSSELIATAWGVSAATLSWWFLRRTLRTRWLVHAQRLGLQGAPPSGLGSNRELRIRLARLGRSVEGAWPGSSARASELAIASGFPGVAALEEIVGMKIVAVACATAIGLIGFMLLLAVDFGILGFVFLLAAPPAGWLSVDFWLARRAAQRQHSIERSLLTVADLLTLCLEAGMGLDRALRLICSRMSSPLTEELLHMLTEVDLGTSRRDALTHLAERVPLEEIRSLATAIIQAEELSASLALAMRTQSRALRLSQRHDLQSEAQRAPIKMLIPMVLFVLPALFIVIIGPAILALTHSLGAT